MQDAQSAAWVKSKYALATGTSVASIKTLTEKQVLEHIGTPILMVEIYFEGYSGLYLTANATDLVYENNVYQAQADLTNISGITNSSEINTDGFTLTLSAIDPAFLSIVQDKRAKDAKVVVSTAFLTPEGDVGTLFTIHQGSISTSTIKHTASSGTFSIDMKTISAYSKLDSIRGQRPANATHQAYFKGDKCFEWCGVDETEEWKQKR